MSTPGERLTFARERMGLTQAELAERTNMARATLSNYERDTREPNIENTVALCSFLGISIDWLFTGNEFTKEDEPLYLTVFNEVCEQVKTLSKESVMYITEMMKMMMEREEKR